MKTIILHSALILIAVSSISNAQEPTSAFLKKHCIRCHGSQKPKSDRRFDNLPIEIKSLDDLERYQEIVDQLNLESMPPEGEPQPTAEERAKMIAHLTRQVTGAHAKLNSSGGHSVLRRLNSWEYRQTIGDLLGINVDVWNPAEDFPAEVKVDGFDNNGAGLVTSGRLMYHYFAGAEEAIRRATQFGDRPPSKKYTQKSPFYFAGKSYKDLPKLFQTDRYRFIPDTPYTDLYGRHYRGGHLGFLPLFRQGGVAHSGIYTIRVRAAAVGRVHDYGKALGDFRNGDPLVMEVASVDRRGSVQSTGNVSKMTSLARIELTKEEPQWFEWDVFMEAGYEPEVRFRNGPLAAKRMVRLLTTQAADKPEFKPFIDMKDKLARANGVLKAYQGPRLRIWEIGVEGPHVDTWPTAGHRALYGNLTPDELNATTIAQRLEAFAEKAFRRPPVDGELEPIQRLIASKLNEGVEPLHALQLGCQAILCSPGFLYLNLGEGELDEVALASRLSYFLWSSPPDETLLKLAAAGKLRSGLSTQVTRMLADSRSDRFVRHFVRRWLDLDNIGTMPPSEDFLEYYRDNLETAMRAETETFFQHVLDGNLSLREFLDADYSFLNRELALHYGVKGVEGNELQRVSLKGSRRGGLIGQGAFLTASANGVDTSPVVRGIYVLEKLLGYTPPPPPPDVPVIEPDIRGAVTIREQLEKHRASATCAACHRKIDPLGFALENFDAIGGWRDEYSGKTPIDATGKLPNGDSFSTVPEFRKLLVDREDQFNRCLTEKLMTYALGRKLEVGDRPTIDRVLAELETREGGLRDLIRLIVLSKPFLSN
jgi:mono/diheme cytochrome c family protein